MRGESAIGPRKCEGNGMPPFENSYGVTVPVAEWGDLSDNRDIRATFCFTVTLTESGQSGPLQQLGGAASGSVLG